MTHVQNAQAGPKFGTSKPIAGYVVTLTLHGFQITKQGVHVGWALSFEDAERKLTAQSGGNA